MAEEKKTLLESIKKYTKIIEKAKELKKVSPSHQGVSKE